MRASMKCKYCCYDYVQFTSRTNSEQRLTSTGTMFEVCWFKFIKQLERLETIVITYLRRDQIMGELILFFFYFFTCLGDVTEDNQPA